MRRAKPESAAAVKPIPPPHPAYVPAPTRRVRIAGRQCVEMDAGKWLGLLQTAEFYSKGKK